MTMPHLMNCQHSDSGWCLECVKKMHDDYEASLDEMRSDYADVMVVYNAACDFVASDISEEQFIQIVVDMSEEDEE